MNDLISMCVQEEERLKADKEENVNLVHANKGKKVATTVLKTLPAGKKGKNSNFSAKSSNPSKGSHDFKTKSHFNAPATDKPCYFCKEVGHLRKDFAGFKHWLIKKGNIINIFVCVESNLVFIPPKS